MWPAESQRESRRVESAHQKNAVCCKCAGATACIECRTSGNCNGRRDIKLNDCTAASSVRAATTTLNLLRSHQTSGCRTAARRGLLPERCPQSSLSPSFTRTISQSWLSLGWSAHWMTRPPFPFELCSTSRTSPLYEALMTKYLPYFSIDQHWFLAPLSSLGLTVAGFHLEDPGA